MKKTVKYMLLAYAFSFTTFIVLMTGLRMLPNIIEGKLIPLLLLLATSLTAEIISFISISYFKSNVLTYNLFTLIETPLVLFLIGSWISPSKFSNLIHYLSTAFFLFWLSESIFITRLCTTFNDYSVMLGGVIVLFVTIIYLYRLSNNSYVPILHLPQFWISSSFLIYYSVSTILLSTMGVIQHEGKDVAIIISNFHIIVHIFTTLLFLKAFRCLPKPSTSLQ